MENTGTPMSSSSRAVMTAILPGACVQNRPASLHAPDAKARIDAAPVGARARVAVTRVDPARRERPFDVPAWAQAQSQPQSPVFVADLWTNSDTAQSGDGVHPDDAGAQRMGQNWFDALRTILTPG
jgi:lysophospholipase L1-like esterase